MSLFSLACMFPSFQYKPLREQRFSWTIETLRLSYQKVTIRFNDIPIKNIHVIYIFLQWNARATKQLVLIFISIQIRKVNQIIDPKMNFPDLLILFQVNSVHMHANMNMFDSIHLDQPTRTKQIKVMVHFIMDFDDHLMVEKDSKLFILWL